MLHIVLGLYLMLKAIEDPFPCNSDIKFNVNFHASGYGSHERLLLSYALFALHSNPDSTVELIVVDKPAYIEKYNAGLTVVTEKFGMHFACV